MRPRLALLCRRQRVWTAGRLLPLFLLASSMGSYPERHCAALSRRPDAAALDPACLASSQSGGRGARRANRRTRDGTALPMPA